MMRTKQLSAKHPEPGEAAVLKRIQAIAGRSENRSAGILKGIGDDAAVLQAVGGYDEILTCDWFLEGTHFLRHRHPPDSVGWKCLARAVSDVAAMGGVPRCFLLSIALPKANAGSWLAQFLFGLRRASKKFGCVLVGGDTTRRDEIIINVTVVGQIRAGRAVLRSEARPGDVIFASGCLGEAQLGLQLIRRTKQPVDTRAPILKKHLYPEPRLELGRWLAERRLPSAMMDLSDGLSSDLPRLCAASGVGARIELAKIPLVRVPKGRSTRSYDPYQLALHGGDDYELLFTVPREKSTQVPPSYRGVPISAIGVITKKRSLLIADETGRALRLPNQGWDPFRQGI